MFSSTQNHRRVHLIPFGLSEGITKAASHSIEPLGEQSHWAQASDDMNGEARAKVKAKYRSKKMVFIRAQVEWEEEVSFDCEEGRKNEWGSFLWMTAYGQHSNCISFSHITKPIRQPQDIRLVVVAAVVVATYPHLSWSRRPAYNTKVAIFLHLPSTFANPSIWLPFQHTTN